MAAEFIGSTVRVTLLHPSHVQISGTVSNIFDQELTLKDAVWLSTGIHQPHIDIQASNIEDLEVAPEPVLPKQQLPPYGHRQGTPSASFDIPERGAPSPISSIRHGNIQPTTLIDPAIVSFSKPSSKPLAPSALSPPPIPRQMLFEAAKGSPTRATPTIPSKPLVPVSTKPKGPYDSPQQLTRSLARATLSGPFEDLLRAPEVSAEAADSETAAELGIDGGKSIKVHLDDPAILIARQTGKKTRRGAKGRGQRNGTNAISASTLPVADDNDSSPLALRKANSGPRPKTLRQQTPLVEADSLGISQSDKQKRLYGRRERLKAQTQQNGWATEDATDIQELGDFDFEGNLSKFDKREIFNQLRRDDTTTEESRLVGHNRLPRVGTSGGKNLHWTENVLESPQHEASKLAAPTNGFSNAKWTSEAGESEVEISDSRISSGRSSRRNMSRTAGRRVLPSRRSSGKGVENIPPGGAPKLLVASFGSIRQSSFSGSPKPKRNISTSPYLGSVTTSRPSLRIIGSNHICPSLSPLQMLEFEQFAISELGLSEDVMTENAARGIAETTLAVLRHLDAEGPPKSPPLIVVVAGNHKSGARAIAASRHLRNHGFRVTATIMGLEREEDLLDMVKQQANAYRKAGGNLMKPTELLAGLKVDILQPTILVDALLGIHTCFDDLRRDDQAWYFELVIWAARTEIKVLSIDVPSGVDASNGEVTIVDDQPLALLPNFLLSMGAPKPWLPITLRDVGVRDKTQLFVADIGISNLAWKRLGNRRNRGIDFGSEWVVQLRYQAGVE